MRANKLIITGFCCLALLTGLTVQAQTPPFPDLNSPPEEMPEARPTPKPRQTVPLRRFVKTLIVAGQTFEVELYAANEEMVQTRLEKLSTTLNQSRQQLERVRQVSLAARQGTVPLATELYGLFEKLRSFCQLSEGAFDPTDRPLRELWGFSASALAYRVPQKSEILAAKQSVDCLKMELGDVPPTLFMANSRLQLNSELFASGWLIDQGIQALEGLPAFMLRSGAVGYYHGTPPDAPAWKVPVPDPRHPETTLSYIYLKNQALTILGDYQNYFLHNGIRYSSLIDARTGYPTEQSVAVHVTAPTALDAELIARATAVLDETGTKALLQSLKRSSVYKIVDRNGLLVPYSY